MAQLATAVMAAAALATFLLLPPPAAIGFVGDGLAQPWVGDVIHHDAGHAMPVPRGRAHGVQFGIVGCAAQARDQVLREHRCTVQGHALTPHPGWK